ncbi:MAG: hypothetical protein HYV76_02370 [Candidatus Vogelbacteria bacterium]|nr:hypothetical protein [Candidatus Vogelbacteria bacterium]
MSWLFSKQVVGAVLLLVLIGLGVYVYKRSQLASPPVVTEPTIEYQIIGQSVEGRNIMAYHFGTGPTELVFIGGIHGGYEWNSVLLAYTFVDYFKAHPESVPKNITVTVIPNLNPDGMYKVVGQEGLFEANQATTSKTVLATSRFNAHQVDLNRNFDCKWQARSTWQARPVSAGTAAFSEPEAMALRDFVLANRPQAVVFWHSQANAVYASECQNGILPVTLDIMTVYATASGYPAIQSFDAYPITGDAEGWLASINIPAITVELKNHETIEWSQNLAGVKALIDYFQ